MKKENRSLLYFKKSVSVLVIICMLFTIISSASAGGLWQDLGQGWKFRVDPPFPGGGDSKYHVHVNNGNNEVGTENVDGTESHGDQLKKVPKGVKDKVRNHPEYGKGKAKQVKSKEAAQKIKDRGLKLDWWRIFDIIAAIAIFIAVCFGTPMFPADDYAAYLNVIRAAS